MSDLDVFRQDFTGLLKSCARDRRRGASCGEDLKIVALLERLAVDAETVDGGVVAACQSRVGQELLARCLTRHRSDLLAEVGVLVWPEDAAALLGWMTRQAASGDPMDEPPESPHGTSDRRPPPRSPAPDDTGGQTPLRAWGCDLCAGFGLVAPLLALWHIGLGIDQLRDRRAIDANPPVLATILSAETERAARSAATTTSVLLAWQVSPGAAPCRVMLRLDDPATTLVAGDTLSVVPRSASCEPPLLPIERATRRRPSRSQPCCWPSASRA